MRSSRVFDLPSLLVLTNFWPPSKFAQRLYTQRRPSAYANPPSSSSRSVVLCAATMAPSTPQPADDSHQQLLDQMDVYYAAKPFRNHEWKPSGRRNKNTKQMISESQRREASVLATQNNSGASTPALATGATTDGAATPSYSGAPSRPVNMAQATQSLSTLVLERNLQKATNGFSGGMGPPAVTYTNIESAPSLHPANHKHYCDITGLPSKYVDPKTKLRYYDQEIFAVVRTLPQGAPDQYLAARGANVVLK